MNQCFSSFGGEHKQQGIDSCGKEETAQALTQEYDVALDTAAIDVQNTIKSLIEAGVAEA